MAPAAVCRASADDLFGTNLAMISIIFSSLLAKVRRASGPDRPMSAASAGSAQPLAGLLRWRGLK
jgi:hypothetical protein